MHLPMPTSSWGFDPLICPTLLWYDCSIEEGNQSDQDGTNYFWPYTLHKGSPGYASAPRNVGAAAVGDFPGLWELPQYAVIVPPDEACEKYGVESGFRDRMKATQSYFDVEDGKITSFDYNLWYEFEMTKAEFVATLSYTFDLRIKGNRVPFFMGVHSDEYAEFGEEAENATYEERREAIVEFIEHVLTHEDTRLVSAKQVLDWLREPVAL